MIEVQLPDGSVRQFDSPVTVMQVAQSIGSGLAKAALAGSVNGQLVDTSFLIEEEKSTLAIITEKNPESLDILRHSTAHLLAYAVKELYPDAQITIGPVIENGFYYDVAYKRSFTPEDLVLIEQRMHELAKKDEPITRRVVSREEAIAFFEQAGESYKAQLIRDIPENQVITLYSEGAFTDLCRGPHVPSTGKLKVFKLMRLAGAYWRGDAKNEMLQRIYGTAWHKKEDQDAYLFMLEEAEKRDHRKLGRALDLFHIEEEAPGLVFWHGKGWTLWQQVEQYLRRVYQEGHYQEVKTPQVLDRSLWEKTGHWDNYHDAMFITESETRHYALKPMSCPGHVLIFNMGLRSYRELPLRFGEFGQCHRNETSGALHGIMRVRGFCQDDGHIFCREDQLQGEVMQFHAQAIKVYTEFGFRDVSVKLATRPVKRIGTDALWDASEAALCQALHASGVQWEELPGEGAFYGPKIEYHLKDSLGRSWQVGTMQVDPSMPKRLDAAYIAEDNSRQHPLMLHRAIIGSFERFIGILIEHHAGAFPLWLAPIQVVVMNITGEQAAYTESVVAHLRENGLRVEIDLRNEKINYKIRDHSLQKIPYMVVIGEKEQVNATVAVRRRGNVNLGVMPLDELIALLREEVARKVQ